MCCERVIDTAFGHLFFQFVFIQLLAISIKPSLSLWSRVGFYHKGLSKGVKTTTWIWNLHADAHDFEAHREQNYSLRKVFSVNLAHFSVICVWLGGMLFHGVYFSNYFEWIVEPTRVPPLGQVLWTIVNQEILNSESNSGNVCGIYVTSGLFYVWRSFGLVSIFELKSSCAAALLLGLCFLLSSYLQMHVSFDSRIFFWKSRSISFHHFVVFSGLGSISWSGHQFHVAIPRSYMLRLGIDPEVIPSATDLLKVLPPSLFVKCFVEHTESVGSSCLVFGSEVELILVAIHHTFVGFICILCGFVIRSSTVYNLTVLSFDWVKSPHFRLAFHLAVIGTASILFGYIQSYIPVYAFSSRDYPTVVSIFTHHVWIGSFFLVGSGAHMAIFYVRDQQNLSLLLITGIQTQRDIILGHLIWVTIFIGFHSFGLFIHNDALQSLGRQEDLFSDNSIFLKPVLGVVFQSAFGGSLMSTQNRYLFQIQQELGTADFLVHHIHSFTLHVVVLIVLKGISFSRSSRLVPDKSDLGFRFPCDGPGRGGTCQISSWDHIYLALFWMYNAVSIIIFHFFWRFESEVWGVFDSEIANTNHITSGDFSLQATTINGWLRSFLWLQIGNVIQSYGTNISAYTLLFLLSHFIWSFSLMFLFSGRGYWQELIESILWAHMKLYIFPSIQPRALSITQGRSVGLTHYLLGGIGCIWCFFLGRSISLLS